MFGAGESKVRVSVRPATVTSSSTPRSSGRMLGPVSGISIRYDSRWPGTRPDS
jgi:hypothetical protein